MLLELYSADCYHCQQLEPHYARAAAVLAQEAEGPITLARMSVDTEKEFVEQNFKMEGTPTLIVLRDGREQERPSH